MLSVSIRFPYVGHTPTLRKNHKNGKKKEKKKIIRTHSAGCVDCVYAMCVKDRNVRIFFCYIAPALARALSPFGWRPLSSALPC